MRRTAYSVGSKHSKTNSGCLHLKNSQHAEKPPRKPNSQQQAKTPQQLMQQQAKLRKKNQASGRAVRNADLPRQARKANRLKSKKPKPRKPHHRHQRSDRSVTANADSHPKPKAILVSKRTLDSSATGPPKAFPPSSHLTPAGRLPHKDLSHSLPIQRSGAPGGSLSVNNPAATVVIRVYLQHAPTNFNCYEG